METVKFKISVLVNNRYGVLTRVSGLFSKRGFNINSLHVDELADPHFSMMFITSTGNDYHKDQIIKQLSKLHDVREVSIIKE